MLRRKKPLTRKTPLRAKRVTRTVERDAENPAAEAHRRLWSILQSREIAGFKFCHQERVGPYTADFACLATRLVVIVDDAPDAARSAWFRENGYRVVEFPAHEVCRDADAVIEAITRCFELRIVARKT